MKSFKFKYFALGASGDGRGGPPSSARSVQKHFFTNFNLRSKRGRRMGVTPGRTRSVLPAQSLVVLLVFVATATIVTAGATTVVLINSQTTGKFTQGQEALNIAEAGADNAVLRVIRDPVNNYTGETLTIGDGTATINVSGTTTKTIVSTGQVGNFIRKVQVVGTFSNNTFAITSWSAVD